MGTDAMWFPDPYDETRSGKMAAALRAAGHEAGASEIDELYLWLLNIATCNTTKDVAVLQGWAREVISSGITNG